MKVVIVGNNVAGTFSAQNIRFLNEDVEIEIYTQEKYPYYTRVNLPELIPEKVQIDKLIVFKDDWYKDKNLNCDIIKVVNADSGIKKSPKSKSRERFFRSSKKSVVRAL